MKSQVHNRSSKVPIVIYKHVNNGLTKCAVEKPASTNAEHDNVSIYRTNRMVKVKPASDSSASSKSKKLQTAQQTIRSTWKQSNHYCCKFSDCSLCTEVCIQKRASMMLNLFRAMPTNKNHKPDPTKFWEILGCLKHK